MTATTQGVRRSIAGLTVTMHAHAAVQVDTLFDTVAAEDVLPHVLLRHRFIPGVTATSDLTGSWDTPGSTRTVHLTNGGRAQERIDTYQRPVSFGYTVAHFTGVFGRLVDHAVGTWQFSPNGDGSQFTWTYRFIARPGRAPIVAAIVRTGWATYMQHAARRCVALSQR